MRNLEQSRLLLTFDKAGWCDGGCMSAGQDSHHHGCGDGRDAQCAELKMYVNLILEISTSFVNHLHIHTLDAFVTAAAAVFT